jgi:aspartate kinase
MMKVLKFGGTSVGSAERIKALIPLIIHDEDKIVVLSAMSGTTNNLVELTNLLYSGNKKEFTDKNEALRAKYYIVIDELFETLQYKSSGKELIDSHFDHIKEFSMRVFTKLQEKAILAQGELISTALLNMLLQEKNIDSTLIPALNFMRIDKDGEPDYFYIRENLQRELDKISNRKLIITQGFICRNSYGEVDNLKRGGSDYSASIIGAAILADEIQIWTDISGFHNNDPRFVEKTSVIRELSFDEAAELAYFGAKILHPSSVNPAREKGIPVRLKNTMEPDDEGTIISSSYISKGYKAVAAKDGITAVKIKSDRMLLAHGFLRKIFEVFEVYKTSIDMITTSEVAVSLTIDNTTQLDSIVKELQEFGQVEVDHGQTIICIVGDFIAEKSGTTLEIFNAMKGIPIRMISYGGSRHNVSLLIESKYKTEALKSLSKYLFK